MSTVVAGAADLYSDPVPTPENIMKRLAMRPFHCLAVVPLLAALVAVGCTQDDPSSTAAPGESEVEAPADAGADAASAIEASPPADAVPPVVVSSDVMIGTALAENGSVQSPARVFAPTDTIHLAVPTAAHVAGDVVRVYWTNPMGRSANQEDKTVGAGEEFVNFEFADADGLAPGLYNVQVDVNDAPIAMVDFTIE